MVGEARESHGRMFDVVTRYECGIYRQWSVGLLGSKALPCASLAGTTTISGFVDVDEVGTVAPAFNAGSLTSV